jgi:predicted phosphodiesterase
VKLLLTHGHKFGVKNDLTDLAFECKYQNVQYGFYGHTHIAKVDEIEGVTLINPGSIGFGNSYCYVNIAQNNLVYKIVQR